MVVIVITKSWLDALITASEIDITHCAILQRDRNCDDGGVCIYVSDFIFKLKDDICTTLETGWAELYLPKTKPRLIGVCYSLPNHMDFLIHLNNVAWTVIVSPTNKLL